jgi:hypothetical protein
MQPVVGGSANTVCTAASINLYTATVTDISVRVTAR